MKVLKACITPTKENYWKESFSLIQALWDEGGKVQKCLPLCAGTKIYACQCFCSPDSRLN